MEGVLRCHCGSLFWGDGGSCSGESRITTDRAIDPTDLDGLTKQALDQLKKDPNHTGAIIAGAIATAISPLTKAWEEQERRWQAEHDERVRLETRLSLATAEIADLKRELEGAQRALEADGE